MDGFLGGLALFTIASAACAASPTLWSLVAFRGLQAVGTAALTPTSLGLLLAATPAEGRVRAVRTWAAIGALAAASGPVIGGLLGRAGLSGSPPRAASFPPPAAPRLPPPPTLPAPFPPPSRAARPPL